MKHGLINNDFMKIPFVSFAETNRQIKEEITAAFEATFDSRWYILGENVKKFEKEFASFCETKHCIGVSNGLDALFLSLKALDIGPGDEVIVPANTYIASALAISYTGATPVFVEPSVLTYNIDPTCIEAAITSATKAIMPVHLYGQCCEMDPILEVASRHNLYVVEDNAQAQGASYKGRVTGSFGHINATSFYPGKNLGALGDAGAITTNSDELAEKVRMLRNYGSKEKYKHEVVGYNMRLDEMQAAFLSVKLKNLREWTRQRQQIAAWYDEALKGVAGLILPTITNDATHVYHLYVIRTKQRDALQEWLSEKGIDTLIHYPVPPHLQGAYSSLNLKKGSFPIAETLSETVLSIPLWIGMNQVEVEYITKTVRAFFYR